MPLVQVQANEPIEHSIRKLLGLGAGQSQKLNRRVEENKRRQKAKLGFEPRERSNPLGDNTSAYATRPVIALAFFK